MNTPYTRAARAYFETGWSPIPLPHEQKFPVPDQFPAGTKQEFTGSRGIYVTEQHVKTWLSAKGRANAGKLSYPPSNIAIRLPKTVIGVDVDAYSGKTGAATLQAAEEEWGALPPTWVSTSKDDGISGIRWFRIPPGLAWPGELPQGKGVELIRWDHRFAIVSPSIHDKTKLPYKWYKEIEAEDGSYRWEEREGEIPDPPPAEGREYVDEAGFPLDYATSEYGLPWMPEAWVEGLTGGAEFAERPMDDAIGADDVRRWIASRPEPEEPCRHMRKQLTNWTVKVQRGADDGGAHQEMVDAIWAVLSDARQGHAGVSWILTKLRNVFLQAVRERRPDEGSAKKEWARAVIRGANKIMSDGNEDEEEDPCEMGGLGSSGNGGTSGGSGASGRGSRRSGSGSSIGSNDIEELNDLGNANRLIRVMRGRARWCEAHASWYLWDEEEGRWTDDGDRQVERWSVKAAVEIEEEAALVSNGENGEALLKAYMAHRKSSLTVGKLSAMREITKGRRGIRLAAEEIDAHPRILGTPDGVVSLGDDSAQHRSGEWARDKFITLRTAVPWVAGKTSPMWEEFLDRFQPDLEIRNWLQRITGYTLLGQNPDRALIVMHGKTSTGKSTFAEAVRTVLGDYGGVMTASILRDNPDDKPRPDLLAAFSRRLIVAEELSAVQHLHADQMKRITGGTAITARGMRSNTYITRRPAFTPWIVTNEVPTIEGADRALLRRVIVVPWTQQIQQEEEDTFYFDRLMESSAEAILAWCVEGYDMWLRDPRISSIPAGALAAAGEFAEGVNDLGAWIAARLDYGNDCFELPSRLYEDYEIWCGENGIKERDRLSGTAFGRRLNGLGLEKARLSIGGRQTWVRLGARLVSAAQESVTDE
jgi:putative DNA primase/helicase